MPAHLHREHVVGAATPRSWAAWTHGILGAGANLRTIARKLVERRADWGIVLVDLRLHGRSEPGAPPHDVAACADDLRALLAELGNVTVIAGHSFGGKVALATRALAPPGLRQTWALDASPGPRPEALGDPANSVPRLLAAMERLPATWTRRDDFVDAIVADGHPVALARWLAMNVVPVDGAPDTLRVRLDLPAIRALLADYYTRDLWAETFDPRLPGDVELVLADRSSAVSVADRARLATAPPHVHVHHVAAGHWLHVDAPEAIVELFAARLPAP